MQRWTWQTWGGGSRTLVVRQDVAVEHVVQSLLPDVLNEALDLGEAGEPMYFDDVRVGSCLSHDVGNEGWRVWHLHTLHPLLQCHRRWRHRDLDVTVLLVRHWGLSLLRRIVQLLVSLWKRLKRHTRGPVHADLDRGFLHDFRWFPERFHDSGNVAG